MLALTTKKTIADEYGLELVNSNERLRIPRRRDLLKLLQHLIIQQDLYWCIVEQGGGSDWRSDGDISVAMDGEIQGDARKMLK